MRFRSLKQAICKPQNGVPYPVSLSAHSDSAVSLNAVAKDDRHSAKSRC